MSLERRGPSLVALSGVLAHATALGAGFVWLDHAHIEGGLGWARPSEWASLFTRPFAGTGFYRPLMALALSLDMAVSPTAPFMHAVTLAWHALAAAFVTWTARELGSSTRASLLAGMAFAVHPMNSLVASAISFRSEAMSLVFLLALVLSHLRTRPVAAALAMAACGLTKETSWLLGPLFVTALTLRSRQDSWRSTIWGKRRLLLAEAFSFLAVSLLRLRFAPAWRADYPALAWDEQIGSRLALLGKGFARALLPLPNTLCDAFPVVSLPSAFSVLGLALLTLLFATRAASPVAKSLLLLSLLPCVELVPIMRWWSPHYFYVPLALAAIAFSDAAERRWGRSPWLVLVALGAVAFSLRDALRFRDDESLWSYEVAHEPACREGHFYLGEVARERGDLTRAARHYRSAAAPVPGFLAYSDEFSAYQNWGAVELASGHFAEARAAFAEARERGQTQRQRAEASHNLAVVAVALGEARTGAALLAGTPE